MKTKKDVFGVIGIVLFVLAVATLSDYDNFVSSGEAKANVGTPYEEIIADIDDSLMKTYSNNDKIQSLNEDLDIHHDQLEDALDDYASLGEEIKKITENIEQIEGEVNRTKVDSNRLKEKRIKLHYQIENDSKEVEANNGFRVWLFYLSLFISVNLFIWFEMSTYYRERNFR